MRKVKEMAREYKEAASAQEKYEVALRVAIEMAGEEVTELARQRNIHTPAAFRALFDEQRRRWLAFVARCPEVNEGGFEFILQQHRPDAYELWKQA